MNSRLRDHLIGLADLNFGWIPLYVATWLLQWFNAAFRYFAALAVLWVANAILELGLPIHTLALIIGFAPLFISLGTLILPLGGWWLQQVEGGRRPSEREQAVFDMAFEQLRAVDPDLRGPPPLVRPRQHRNQCAGLCQHPGRHSCPDRQPRVPSGTRPRARASQFERCAGNGCGVSDHHLAARAGGETVQAARLLGLRPAWLLAHENTVGHLLAPSRGERRPVRGEPRTGSPARQLPGHLRAWRRSANAVQGNRRNVASLDRASHRGPRATLGEQLTPVRTAVKVAPSGWPCGPGLSPLPMTAVRPSVKEAPMSAGRLGRKDF
jgi:hypothetical protein